MRNHRAVNGWQRALCTAEPVIVVSLVERRAERKNDVS